MIITIKCPNCGAQVTFNNKKPFVVCKYCDALLTQDCCIPASSVQQSEMLKSFSERVSSLSNSQRFLTRFYVEDSFQRGYLYVTPYELVFRPSKKESDIKYNPLLEVTDAEICKSEESYHNAVLIKVHLVDDKELAMHVLKRDADEIIDIIMKCVESLHDQNVTLPTNIDYGLVSGAKRASDIISPPKQDFWAEGGVGCLIFIVLNGFYRSDFGRNMMSTSPLVLYLIGAIVAFMILAFIIHVVKEFNL